MPSVQIKDVPDDVHAELRRRAAMSGHSLQDYLLGWLIEATSQPPLDELLDRVGGRSGGRMSFSSAAASIRHDREAR